MNGLIERENAINIVKEVIPAAFWFEELNPNGRRVMLDAVIAAGTGRAPGYNVE